MTVAKKRTTAAQDAEPKAVEFLDIPEEPQPEEAQQAQHFVVVITDPQGYPQSITPQGLPTTALPAVLRLAAKMTERHLET